METAGEENFRSFLAKRKREYSMMFPFLKDAQIVAKLRKIWSNKRRNSSLHCEGEPTLSCLRRTPAKPGFKGFSETTPPVKQAAGFDFDQENVPPSENPIRTPTSKLVKLKPLSPAKTFSPPRVSALKYSSHPTPTIALQNCTKQKSDFIIKSVASQSPPQPLKQSHGNCNHSALVPNTTKHPLEDSITADTSPACLAKNMENLHVCSEDSIHKTPPRRVHWQSPVHPNTVHLYTPFPSSYDTEDPTMEVSTELNGSCMEDESGELLSTTITSLSPVLHQSLHTAARKGIRRKVNLKRQFNGMRCPNLCPAIESDLHQCTQPDVCIVTAVDGILQSVHSSDPCCKDSMPSSGQVEVKGDLKKAPKQVAVNTLLVQQENPQQEGSNTACTQPQGKYSGRKRSSRLPNKERSSKRLKTIDMSESLPDITNSQTLNSTQGSAIELNASTCSLPTNLSAANTLKRRRAPSDIGVPVRMTRSRTAALRRATEEAEKSSAEDSPRATEDAEKSSTKDSLLEENFERAISQSQEEASLNAGRPSLKKSRLSSVSAELVEHSEGASHDMAVDDSAVELVVTEAADSGHVQSMPVECASSEPFVEYLQISSQASPNPPVKEGLMCDLFSPLPPGRKVVNAYTYCLTGSVAGDDDATKRRVFHSATVEGESNFYTMFTDESDIFM